MTAPKLSFLIISFNEEPNVQRLLPLLAPVVQRLGAELVVVDSFSTDRTVELFKEAGARVYSEEWKGLVRQKQSCLDKCEGDWIFLLDCDEFLDKAMFASLIRIVETAAPSAYKIRRRTTYLGRELRYAWQPDVHLRLFHRALHPHIESVNGHDIVRCDTEEFSYLDGWMAHHSYRSIQHHMDKTLFYARIGAAEYAEQGRRFSMFNLLVNPCIAFFKMAVLRRGLLDGFPGLVACFSTAMHVFLKYAMLRELQDHKKIQP